MALECIRLHLCCLCSFCPPQEAFALAKSTDKLIFLIVEIIDCANLFRCLKMHAEHFFIKQSLKRTWFYLFYHVQERRNFTFTEH